MKIRQQGIDDAELKGRADEEISIAGKWFERTIRGGRFQEPDGGGAHGHDAAAGRAALQNSIGDFLPDRAPLGMHLVLGQQRRGDRPERAGPGVQRERAKDDLVFLQAAEQRFAEVQAGGRGSDGPRPAGIDRLILLPIGLLHFSLADVGRQGHPPDTCQQGEGFLVALGTHDPTAVGLLGAQVGVECRPGPGRW